MMNPLNIKVKSEIVVSVNQRIKKKDVKVFDKKY